MYGGRQRGTKLCARSIVHRQEKRVLTNHSSSSFSRDAPAERVGPTRSAGASRLNEEELWFVNTRFSCLCTIDRAHSFVPRWRPPYITALAPEDRCHLNGLGLVNGEVRYVTALG